MARVRIRIMRVRTRMVKVVGGLWDDEKGSLELVFVWVRWFVCWTWIEERFHVETGRAGSSVAMAVVVGASIP